MARIFIDGFEGGDTAMWTTTNSATVTASPPAGMSGAYYIAMASNGWVKKTLSTSYSELYIAAKIKYGTAQNDMITLLDSAGTVIFAVGRTAAAKLQCYRGGTSGTAIGSLSSLTLTLNQIYLVEVYYKPLNANGLVTVKVDGTTEITIAAIDALDTTAGLENVQTILFGNAVTNTLITAIDDVVVDTANWIGNTKITALVPTGAGATSAHDCVVSTWTGDPASQTGAAGLTNRRTVIPASEISTSGSRIKLCLKGGSANSITISGCSIGERSGSTSTFNGAPTRVTFNNGSSTASLPAATSIYSDWITFTIDETKSYLIHFYCSAGYYAYGTGSHYNETSADADDTLTETLAGYSSTAFSAIASKILVELTDGASNYSTVDENPASDDDYTFTNTENAVDTYAIGNLPGTGIGTIKAVAVQSRNRRVGNGAVNKIQHVLRPTSTDRVGASSGMIPISAASLQTIWELNPDDSGVWEKADINGMEAGIKAVT